MSHYTEIYPSLDVVLGMEPEELAPYVLKHLNIAGHSKLNRHNFLLGSDREFIEWTGGSHQQMEAVIRRFSSAWMWLERELLIAPKGGGDSWYFITERGEELLASGDFEAFQQAHLLPSEGLDSVLIQKAKSAFIRGEYDTAVFLAFKEVEVRVRDKAGLSASDIGVALMRKAFNPTDGILTDQTMEGGEKTARMELFAGCIGSFKNPSSHRDVDLTDPYEVAHIIHTANVLLRIVGSIGVS